MIKSAYSKRLNPLLSGKSNFICDGLDKIDTLVRDFVVASFTHYSNDGNVKHIEGASMALTYLHPSRASKVQNIVFSLAKGLRANHYGFNLVIPLLPNGKLNPLEHTFLYKKVDKKMRPPVTVSLDRTLRELNVGLNELFQKRPSTVSESQKAERALKAVTTGMLDFSSQMTAVKQMGLEDRKEWMTGMTTLLAEADKIQNPAKHTQRKKRPAPKGKVRVKRATAVKGKTTVGKAMDKAKAKTAKPVAGNAEKKAA